MQDLITDDQGILNALDTMLGDDPVFAYADASQDTAHQQMNSGIKPDGSKVPKIDPKKYDPGEQHGVGQTSQSLADAGVSHHVDAADPADPHVHCDDDAHACGKKLQGAGYEHVAHGSHAPPVGKCGGPMEDSSTPQGTRVNAFQKDDTTLVVSHKPSSYGGGKFQDGKTAVTAHTTKKQDDAE